MPNLTTLGANDLRAVHDDIRRRYQAFAERKLKLNLTRGKPSSKQLDLCNELLRLPGADYLAGGVDTRNYGELQGLPELPELRALLAPIFGVSPERVILGDNASLSLMHDAVVYSMLKGTVDSERPWSRESRVAFICPVPGYDRHFSICAQFGIEMIPVPMLETGPDI
jgi:DNA-binding transcriptional MocR family regulator